MQNQLPLKPEQLEVVFDSLDTDGNGTLTFEEFIQGFGKRFRAEELRKMKTFSFKRCLSGGKEGRDNG